MRLSHDTHHTKSIFSEKNTIRKKIKLQWKKNTICMKILTIPCLQKIMNTLMYSSHYFRGLPPIPLFHILLKTLFLGGTPLSPFLLEHPRSKRSDPTYMRLCTISHDTHHHVHHTYHTWFALHDHFEFLRRYFPSRPD